MNTLEPIVMMGAATVASFGLALLVNWLMLHALFHLLPGRRAGQTSRSARPLISFAGRTKSWTGGDACRTAWPVAEVTRDRT